MDSDVTQMVERQTECMNKYLQVANRMNNRDSRQLIRNFSLTFLHTTTLEYNHTGYRLSKKVQSRFIS